MKYQIKKNKDMKEAEEKLKGQEKKKKNFYFIFDVFYHYTILRSSS